MTKKLMFTKFVAIYLKKKDLDLVVTHSIFVSTNVRKPLTIHPTSCGDLSIAPFNHHWPAHALLSWIQSPQSSAHARTHPPTHTHTPPPRSEAILLCTSQRSFISWLHRLPLLPSRCATFCPHLRPSLGISKVQSPQANWNQHLNASFDNIHNFSISSKFSSKAPISGFFPLATGAAESKPGDDM